MGDYLPAETYAIGSRLRPGQLKLGKSNVPTKRRSGMNAGDPSLFIVESFAFLHALNAEQAAQRHFHSLGRHVEGEWYRVTIEEVRSFYRKLQATELPAIRATLRAAKFIENHQNSLLNDAGNSEATETAMLLRRTLARTGLTVAEGIHATLAGTNTPSIVAALQKVGILVQKGDNVALIDRTPAGPISRFFKGTAFEGTWRKHFSRIAGFDSACNYVKMASWKKNTLASQEVLDKVCAI